MSKSTTKPATTTTDRNELIAQYRKLGSDMKTLRDSHLADIAKLIKKYKADKAAIVAKRNKLLAKIREPKAEVTEAAA